jgi:hypothetical protein
MGANKYWKNIKKIRLLVNGKCTLPVKKKENILLLQLWSSYGWPFTSIISTTAVFVYIFCLHINFRKNRTKTNLNMHFHIKHQNVILKNVFKKQLFHLKSMKMAGHHQLQNYNNRIFSIFYWQRTLFSIQKSPAI